MVSLIVSISRTSDLNNITAGLIYVVINGDLLVSINKSSNLTNGRNKWDTWSLMVWINYPSRLTDGFSGRISDYMCAIINRWPGRTLLSYIVLLIILIILLLSSPQGTVFLVLTMKDEGTMACQATLYENCSIWRRQ